MTPISDFCEKRGIGRAMEEAFTAYCRFNYASQYELNKDGDTIKAVMQKMNQSQLEQAWKDFTKELSRNLPQEQVS